MNSGRDKKVYIPDRFSEPMTPELLAELEAYKKIYEAEVERVRRVCAYWKANGLGVKSYKRPTEMRIVK